VHIYQLLWLHLIAAETNTDGADDQLFSSTASRWIDYMNGKRAKHN